MNTEAEEPSSPSHNPFLPSPSQNYTIPSPYDPPPYTDSASPTERPTNGYQTQQAESQQQQEQQQQLEQPQQYDSQSSRARHINPNPYYLSFTVTAIERSNIKNPIIRFDAKTNLPRYRSPIVRDIRRTHYELLKLQDHLIFANPEAIVPAVPPPVTSAGAGTEEDDRRMKGGIQRWFDTISQNALLIRDEEVLLFVESDFGYSPVHAHGDPTKGISRRVKKQSAPPPDDNIELADARPIIKSFYLSTEASAGKLEKVSKRRAELSRADAEFASRLQSLSMLESHPGLARAYRQLSRAFIQKSDIQSAQSIAELTTLSDPLQLLSQNAFIAKETLTTRQFIIREFLEAQRVSKAKFAGLQRLKSGGKIDEVKVDEALAQYEDAKARETELGNKVQRVTGNLVYDRRAWTARMAGEGKMGIRDFVERMIEIERRILGVLEVVRPDVRNIDSSGGLSWLGRETHRGQATKSRGETEGRRSRGGSLVVSQGPMGDAWSGVERRNSHAPKRSSGSSVPPEASLEGDEVVREEEEEESDRVDARSAAMFLSAQL